MWHAAFGKKLSEYSLLRCTRTNGGTWQEAGRGKMGFLLTVEASSCPHEPANNNPINRNGSHGQVVSI